MGPIMELACTHQQDCTRTTILMRKIQIEPAILQVITFSPGPANACYLQGGIKCQLSGILNFFIRAIICDHFEKFKYYSF